MNEIVPYTNVFKEQMVRWLLGTNAVSANGLGKSLCVPPATLSKWLLEARSLAYKPTAQHEKLVEAPQKWPVEEKLRVVAPLDRLEGQALGEFRHDEDLHEVQVKSCAEPAEALMSVEAAGAMTAKTRRRLTVAEKRVKEHERELRLKEKTLAEAAPLLMPGNNTQPMGSEKYQSIGEEADSNSESEK